MLNKDYQAQLAEYDNLQNEYQQQIVKNQNALIQRKSEGKAVLSDANSIENDSLKETISVLEEQMAELRNYLHKKDNLIEELEGKIRELSLQQ